MPICEYCGNNFTTGKILLNHQQHAKYCLEIQGKSAKKYQCECGNEYVLKTSLIRHQSNCSLHPVSTKLCKQEAQNEALQRMVNNYESLLKELQKQISTRPTNNRNVVMNNMSAITDEQLQEHLEHLTLNFIAEGAKGYADFAKCYPLKDNVICTDKARKKIKYKNEEGEVSDDSRMLAKRFFQAISRRNKDILDTAYRDLHEEIKGIVAENRAGEIDITGLLTKAAELQSILIKSQRAATGEDEEFTQEFLGHLTKML